MRPERIDRLRFDQIAEVSGKTLISIYLPTHVKGAEVKQDRIRLKNGLAEVDARLEKEGWTPKDRANRLDPARLLLEDAEFWTHQGPGLGVLIDDRAETAAVALATDVAERVVVSTVFHLRPMVPSVGAVELPVLVLTKGGVRLYRASRYDISRVDADLPESFEDVNWFVDRERQRQRHPDRTGTNRSRHGHEGGYRDEDLDRFLRAVANALPHVGDSEPLVVLGDDNLTARFGKVSEREIISPPNSGIDEVDELAEIRERAAGVVRGHEAGLLERQLEAAQEGLGTGAAITEITEGLKAAATGRISTLLLDGSAEPVWGLFDPGTLETIFHENEETRGVDLLDRLAVHCLSTGAEVVINGGPVEGHPFVAITRF